jgi:hypothetical protein
MSAGQRKVKRGFPVRDPESTSRWLPLEEQLAGFHHHQDPGTFQISMAGRYERTLHTENIKAPLRMNLFAW